MPTATDLAYSSLDVPLPCDIKEKPLLAVSNKPKRKRARKDIDVPLVYLPIRYFIYLLI